MFPIKHLFSAGIFYRVEVSSGNIGEVVILFECFERSVFYAEEGVLHKLLTHYFKFIHSVCSFMSMLSDCGGSAFLRRL